MYEEIGLRGFYDDGPIRNSRVLPLEHASYASVSLSIFDGAFT